MRRPSPPRWQIPDRITVNDEKITDAKAQIKLEGETIVRKGKKAFKKVVVK